MKNFNPQSNFFNLKKSSKQKKFLKNVIKLNNHHFRNCKEYKGMIISNYPNLNNIDKLKDMPMIPVKLFKLINLKSIKEKNIYKIIYSSGTSSDGLSKIYLDKNNAKIQIQVLNNLFSEMITSNRYPMLIIDKNIKNNFDNFNAQKAAITGFSIFGKKKFFLLKDDNKINYDELRNFKDYVGKEKYFIFGFTDKVYEYLIKKLDSKYLNKNAVIIHGGGWKKLEKFKISNEKFKKLIFKKFKISRIHNYYGMIEQTGSIFFECKKGFFHTSVFSEIFIRDQYFNNLKFNKKGLIQLISLVPVSYPGHNILTEDIGEIFGEDNCKCGLKGKYFKVYGRLQKSEIRGCGNIND